MTRLQRLLALLLALMLVAGACGDDDDDAGGGDTGGDTDTGEDGTDSALPDLSGQSIEVAAIWTDTEQQRFEQVLAGFEEATGASVSYTPAGDDMDVVLGGRIAGGDPPDVAIVGQPALLRKLAAAGDLISIEETAGPVIDENYDAGAREAGSHEGTLYGVVFKVANKSLLWNNTDVLGDAGVEPPGTWDELTTALQTVSDSGVTPLSVGGGDGWTLTDWFENVLLQTAGPDFYDQLANGEASWDSEEVKTALTTLSEVWTDSFVVGGLTGATSIGFTESVTQTWTEPAGFVYEGDFVAGVISGEISDQATVGENAQFSPFPTIDGAPASVLVGGDTAVQLVDNEAAGALMSYLATPEAAAIWAAEGGFLSSNRNVDPSTYPDDVTREAAQLIADAEVTRFDLSDLVPPEFGATSGQGMWKILQDFLANPSDVDSIAAALEAAAA